MKHINIKNFALLLCTIILMACGTQSATTTIADGVSVFNYKHIAFGSKSEGSAELSDIILSVENELSRRFNVVDEYEANNLLSMGTHVLTPSIDVTSEKWSGGRTYIIISLKDLKSGKIVAVVKSSGIGMSIEEDQKRALNAIKKELDNYFPRIR
jgi:hypothetical protein